MNVLQLCTYYIGNQLYKKLFTELSEKNVSQKVYIPIRSEVLKGRNIIEHKEIDFYYDFVLNKIDRFLYKNKIRKQYKNIQEKVSDIESLNIIHAHTLFSDGGTAYLLSKKYNKKYIVSIRNTDINVFYKYGIHLRPFIFKVLQKASAVIFISHAYKNKTFELLPLHITELIKDKSYVIPNGIDDMWLEYNEPKTKDINKKLRLLFIGSIDPNKNLITVLKLLKLLVDEEKDVYLSIAGEGLSIDEMISYIRINNLENRVQFHGKIPPEKLIPLADKSDVFILPSFKETFGIAYIEAMARGLPIIYTKNEGIDGYFKDGSVGFSTSPNNVEEIKYKLDLILEDYSSVSKNCYSEAKKFNWNRISNIYIDLYEQVVVNK